MNESICRAALELQYVKKTTVAWADPDKSCADFKLRTALLVIVEVQTALSIFQIIKLDRTKIIIRVDMGQFTSKQWDEMTEVNKVVEEAKEEEHQKQSAGGKKSSLSQRVKTRILRSGNS